jgi:altronate dehydratase
VTRIWELGQVARLPAAGDNVAIAVQRLEAGTAIKAGARQFCLQSTVMEGHRFAVAGMPAGAPLLSWGLPFGVALHAIEPGDYVCNEGMLAALAGRDLDFALPGQANFADCLAPYELDEATFIPGNQVAPVAVQATFRGFDRGPRRGAGTRSFVVVLGTSSRTGGVARVLAQRLQDLARRVPRLDGIVAVDHTEGGGTVPNSLDLVLRTLSGFLVHPNVAAVLALDYGGEAVNNARLQAYAQSHGYPLADVPHRFLSLDGALDRHLETAARQVSAWLNGSALVARCEQPVARLRLGLQCGGSDAFSGVSGNPLLGAMVRELICHGGSANLAETDELMGAEAYVLRNVRDLDTARRFLATVARFKERLAWHGESAEANPSGGNKYRGLYNISLKSIGAATKRHPDVRLDDVIDYAEPMVAPGYYFMDSPGNDLESMAGQVASGCNLIAFTTGNGSVTNFPFVPTVKITTTTRRHRHLARDMDINAGAYLDGAPMGDLARQGFSLLLSVASGTRSQGERAGHAQVQLWRAWPQTEASALAAHAATPAPAGAPLVIAGARPPAWSFSAWRGVHGPAVERIGLVLPASLCSAQVACLAAARLNARAARGWPGIDRFVALPHTEGCGVAGPGTDGLFDRVVLGHLAHPSVQAAVVLEHGCEKTHNDYIQRRLAAAGPLATPLGWASVQGDGGNAAALAHVEAWFVQSLAAAGASAPQPVGLGAVRLGASAVGAVREDAAATMGQLVAWVIGAGGTVVVPANASLWTAPAFTGALGLAGGPEPTLAHGQAPASAGLHCMACPSADWAETVSGLGAAGVHLVAVHAGEHPLAGHPLVPVVQFSTTPSVVARHADDLDLHWLDGAADRAMELLACLGEVASRRQIGRADAAGNWVFQVTRGLLGVSM